MDMTPSSSYKLDVNGAIRTTVSDGNNGLLVTDQNATMVIRPANSGGYGYFGTTTGHALGFLTSGSVKMMITSSGSVGVNTTSPSYTLDVNGSFRATNIYSGANIIAGTNVNASGSIGCAGSMMPGTSMEAGSYVLATTYMRVTNNISNGASYVGNWSGTDWWGVGQHGSSLPNAVRIGRCNTSTGDWGSTYCDVFVKSLTQTSDYRLKTNVRDIPYGLSQINQLKPIIYDFKDGSGYDEIGFLAHEVQEHIPSVVFGDKDGLDDNGTPIHQGVNYAQIVPALTKAVQELSGQLDIALQKILDLESTQKN